MTVTSRNDPAITERTKHMSKCTVGEYKGKPILALNPDDRFPFQFGIPKARLILENLEAIKTFVNTYDPKPAPTQAPKQEAA